MFLGRRTSKQSHNRFRSLRLEELESREVFSNAILFIGNSYTALTNPETYIDTFVRDLAVAGGQPAPDIVRSIIYGSTLQEHANSLSPAAIRALLPAGDANWDYVVIQSLAEETSTQEVSIISAIPTTSLTVQWLSLMKFTRLLQTPR